MSALPKVKVNRQPSVKHTATSMQRILKANPLLKFEFEGKAVPVELLASSDKNLNPDELFKHSGPVTGKQSLTVKYKPKPPIVSQTASKSVDNIAPKVGRYPNYLKSSSSITSKQVAKKDNVVTDNFKVPNVSTKTKKPNPVKNEQKPKIKRRSLSAQHIDRRKGKQNIHPSECIHKNNLTQSMEDLASQQKPIIEEEKSMIFKTPSAYQRRTIVFQTPISTNKRCLFSDRNSTRRLPTLAELQKRLNDWLTKRGKSSATYSRLKIFGTSNNKNQKIMENMGDIDEENKENVEVPESKEDNEAIARQALEDLHELILDGFDRDQCEHWLYLVRQNYRNLENEPQFWECKAAIEQTRRNIGQAIEYYQNAIINGAEVKSVDKSLDHLLEKFSILNLDSENIEDKKLHRERVRMVQDARNVFKSSIIQFAVQERKLKAFIMSLLIYFAICKNTVLLVSSLSTETPVDNMCQKCDCKWTGGKYGANCSSKFLTEIPDYLPRDIKTIDLSNNELIQLNNEEFSKAHLENIHELLMKSCSIEKVDDLAFKGMLILTTLDLSKNKISNLSDTIFKDNKDLRRIYLSYNKIKFISGNLFIDVLNVEEIFLNSNEIEFVNYSSFGHLTKLRQLNLNRNNLKFLDLDLVNLNRLTNFDISGNLWVCDCSLEPLKNKIRALGLDLSRVVCDSPYYYRGSSWRGNWVFDCLPSTVTPKVSNVFEPRVLVKNEVISEDTKSDTTEKGFLTDISVLIIVHLCVIILVTIIVIIGGLVYLFKPKKNSNLNSKDQYIKDDDGEEELSHLANKSLIANQVVKPPRMSKSAEELDSRQNQDSEVYSSLDGPYKPTSSRRVSVASSIELRNLPPDLLYFPRKSMIPSPPGSIVSYNKPHYIPYGRNYQPPNPMYMSLSRMNKKPAHVPRLSYMTLPRKPRMSWNSEPPVSEVPEPIYDNLGIRSSKHGKSKDDLSFNRYSTGGILDV